MTFQSHRFFATLSLAYTHLPPGLQRLVGQEHPSMALGEQEEGPAQGRRVPVRIEVLDVGPLDYFFPSAAAAARGPFPFLSRPQRFPIHFSLPPPPLPDAENDRFSLPFPLPSKQPKKKKKKKKNSAGASSSSRTSASRPRPTASSSRPTASSSSPRARTPRASASTSCRSSR